MCACLSIKEMTVQNFSASQVKVLFITYCSQLHIIVIGIDASLNIHT